MKILYKRLVEKHISHVMRLCRKKQGLTQEQMAEKLSIDVRSYSDIERRKSGISLFTFLCFIFNCDVDTISLLQQIQSILDTPISDFDDLENLIA